MTTYESRKKEIEEKYARNFIKFLEDEAHYSAEEVFRIKDDILDKKKEQELQELKKLYEINGKDEE